MHTRRTWGTGVVGIGMVQACSTTNGALRIASVQMEIHREIHVNLARLLRGIAEGAHAGARVVQFPETALSGFDRQTVVNMDWDSLTAAMVRVASAAREHNVYVLYGCATPSGLEPPYNSAIVVGPDGHEVTRYHKMVPEEWFAPGDHLAYFAIDGVPCTLMICHDNRYPELVRIPAIRGARICFYLSYEVNTLPTALRKMEGYRAQLIARAVENGIWVVQSNGIGSLPDEPNRVVLGYSRIVNPDGVVEAEAPGMVDTMLVHDIDPERATRGNARNSPGIALLADWWEAGVERLGEPAADTIAASSPVRDVMRLALLQGVPARWELEANMRLFRELAAQAAEGGAELLVTCEGFLDGYASTEDDSTPQRLRAVAQDLDESPYLRQIAGTARRYRMAICFGCTTLEQERIYNAAVLYDANGVRIGVYRKTHLQNHDLQYAPGASLPVFDTVWGQVGIMICADRRWPETARTLRLKGARLILNPSYGMHHEANEWWMRTRGYENQCFIAFAHPKVGFIVDPQGNLAAKRAAESPGVLICEIDLTHAREDNHLRDRRPELYQAITHLGRTPSC